MPTLTNAVDNTVDRMMIVSSYEANLLYPVMKDAHGTTLHLYKPRCNAAYAAIDQLDLHMVPSRSPSPSVPRSLAVQLILFAGQLYVTTHEDHLEICQFLGVWMEEFTDDMQADGWSIAADRFVLRDGRGRVGGDSRMRQSSVHFIKPLM